MSFGATIRRALVSTSVLLVAAACGGNGDDPPDPPYRLEPDCPAPTEVHDLTVDDLNGYLDAADLPAWQAADIGASASLGDDRLIWVFGDTVRSEGYATRIVANSMLVSSGTCVSQLMPAGDGPVIPDEPGHPSIVHWPMSVVVLEAPIGVYSDPEITDVVVVFTARTQRGGTENEAAWDYVFVGTSVAVFIVADDGVPTLSEVTEITPHDESLDQINWGAASTVAGDWLYVYGTHAIEGEFGRELYVARIPASDPRDQAGWRVWNGESWVQDEIGGDAAAPVLAADGGVSQTLSVHESDGTFIAVSKRDGDLGDFVSVWSAPSPTGPWTPGDTIEAPTDIQAGELQYAPLAHPQIDLASGNLLVSISRNTTDFQRLLAEPQAAGRPVFAEVTPP